MTATYPQNSPVDAYAGYSLAGKIGSSPSYLMGYFGGAVMRLVDHFRGVAEPMSQTSRDFNRSESLSHMLGSVSYGAVSCVKLLSTAFSNAVNPVTSLWALGSIAADGLAPLYSDRQSFTAMRAGYQLARY